MSPRRYDVIAVAHRGWERHRIEVESEVREELLRRHRAEIEASGPPRALLLRAKISLKARGAARRLSERGWYLVA